jgi:hypothetical protein
MAQVSFPIVDLPTRDSSLQIFSYPKQEDLAVQGLLSDGEKVVDVIYRPRTCKRRLTGTGSLNAKVHHSVEFTFKTRR